jgi:hypothetical protein
MMKTTEALLDASKIPGQEINTEKSKYVFMSCHLVTNSIQVDDRSVLNVAKFKHFGTTVKN